VGEALQDRDLDGWNYRQAQSSASLSVGEIPTLGRHGTISGTVFNRSSTLTYSAVARASSSVVTTREWAPSPYLRSHALDSFI
jgi:hypothetical protein